MAKYDGSIVVTGMGAVSPFGAGVEAFWSALEQGEHRGTLFAQAESGEPPVPGLRVEHWQPADLLGKRGLQYLRPGAQFLLAASLLALQKAGLADGGTQPDELGVTVGCNLVGLQSITDYDYTAIKEGPRYVSPMEAPNTLANAPASHLAIRLKARALNTTIASGQCAGLDALGYAMRAMRAGRAGQVVAGGVEELSPAVLWLYRHTGVLAGECMENAGRPFDAHSTGLLPSEGAAVVVLERATDTLARGACPLAELVGWSSAFACSQSPEQRASVLRRTAQQALCAADVSPEQIDIVLAGANGLKEQDQAEALALQGLLRHNTHASVIAIKETLGEAYGASGLFQMLAAVRIIKSGIVPPTATSGQKSSAISPVGKHRIALLLAQDLFGSTSAVVLRDCQDEA